MHRLTAEQVAEFDDKGVCFIHSVFSESEISSLRSELPRLLARSGDGVVREPDAAEDTVRIVYGCHVFSEQFRLLSLHPRLLRPVQQLLREESVYIHQTRLNPKQPFGGGTWDWHQVHTLPNSRYPDRTHSHSLIAYRLWRYLGLASGFRDLESRRRHG